MTQVLCKWQCSEQKALWTKNKTVTVWQVLKHQTALAPSKMLVPSLVGDTKNSVSNICTFMLNTLVLIWSATIFFFSFIIKSVCKHLIIQVLMTFQWHTIMHNKTWHHYFINFELLKRNLSTIILILLPHNLV